MAAQATTKRADRPRRSVPTVEQPPRTILVAGERVDVSHLTGEALFDALKRDEEQWDYPRLAAETGRSVVRLRKWVSNAYRARDGEHVEDDKTFIVPDDFVGGSPWWRAGRAREVLFKIGVMERDGRAVPYKPTGRKAGAKDLVKRKRWDKAPARDAAPGIYAEYVELTSRKQDPLTDRQARAALCERHRLTRTQLNRRLNAGREQAEAGKGNAPERPALSNEQLAERLDVLLDKQYRAGVTGRAAESRARERLAAETGLTRRQLATRITLAAQAAQSTGGDG